MSLDEIVAAEEAEAETADSDNGDLGDDEGSTVETPPVDESADDVIGDSDESTADDEGKEG